MSNYKQKKEGKLAYFITKVHKLMKDDNKANYKSKKEREVAQFVTKVHKLVCLEIFMIILFCFFVYAFNLEYLVTLKVLLYPFLLIL